MSNKNKVLAIKVLTVLTLVFLLLLVPGSFIFTWFLDEKLFLTLAYIDMGLMFATGIVLIILLFVFGGMPLKQEKAEKWLLKTENFEELLQQLKKSLAEHQYSDDGIVDLEEQKFIHVFTRKRMFTIDTFLMFRTPELVEEDLTRADEALEAFYQDMNKNQLEMRDSNLTLMVCVDRVTPSFQKFVNGKLNQEFSRTRLPVGVSFGGKQIYVARQKDGFAVGKYKKLRKELLTLVPIKQESD